MAAMRAVVPRFSKSSATVFSRCCAAARRATRAAGLVGDHSACRFMSSTIVGDDYATVFISHGSAPISEDERATGFFSFHAHDTGFASARCDTLAAGVVGFYSSDGRSSYNQQATGFASTGAGSGEKDEDGQNPGPSTNLTLQEAIDMVKKLNLNTSERKIFLKAVDNKFNLYKSPAEVAEGIRKLDLKTIPKMTWLLEALYVKCGPWIYVVDHQLKKRGIKEQPDFTMEYEESPSEMRTELKIDRVLQGQRVAGEILGSMSKTLSALEKPTVPMFSITIRGRTLDLSSLGGLLWKM